MTRTRTKTPDFDAASRDILAALDVADEYRTLGVEVTGREPNSGGWLECRAVDRDDRSPSAAINVKSGRYIDKGGGGVSLSFWDFAAVHGAFADWKEARKHYADRAGVSLGRGRSKKDPGAELAIEPWNDVLVQLWCQTKPGVTPEAIRAAGGCRAHYPAKTRAHHVIALPVYGSRLVHEDPCGWVVWNSGGRPLPVYGRDGTVTGTVKMKTVAGSRAGLMGFHALARLATEPATKTIWKVEGPTDMLALWALIPPDQRDDVLVVCNSGGSTENIQPETAALFAGHCVHILHDADQPGEVGAAKWLAALGPVATKVRQIRLPYAIVENHGKDLRDYIQETQTNGLDEPGHSPDVYQRLTELARATPAFTAGPRSTTPVECVDAYPRHGEDSTAIGVGGNLESDGLVEQRIVDALQLDVLGERENGTVVLFAAHESRRKTVEVRELDRGLSYARLLQIAGPPVQACVDESGEESHGRITLSQIKNAISYLAGAKRITDRTLAGVGCWQARDDRGDDVDGVVVVGAGESAVWDGTTRKLTRVIKPRAGGRLLHLSSSEPWYHFSALAGNLDRCTPQWCEEVINQASSLFSRWRWQYQEVTPEVLTGLVLATWVQTLWEWRPQVAILGATQTGKSTLFEVVGGLFDGLAIRSSKSTAAGIRQAIRTSAGVVLCDEFEKGRHRAEVLEMLRASSRGDEVLRGTTGQEGKRFILRHLVWVAAIEVGLDRAPDRNRFLTLELLPPKKKDRGKLTTPPAGELCELGQRLLAVAIRHIHATRALASRLKAVPFGANDPRVIECYAVPAAMLATACGMDDETAGGLLARMLATVSVEEQGASDEEDLLQSILRASVRMEHDTQTVAELLVGGGTIHTDALARHGLAFAFGRSGPREYVDDAEEYLFVDHRDVRSKLLRQTEWAEQSIDTILKRIPGASASRRWIGSRRASGVLIPMSPIRREYLLSDKLV